MATWALTSGPSGWLSNKTCRRLPRLSTAWPRTSALTADPNGRLAAERPATPGRHRVSNEAPVSCPWRPGPQRHEGRLSGCCRHEGLPLCRPMTAPFIVWHERCACVADGECTRLGHSARRSEQLVDDIECDARCRSASPDSAPGRRRRGPTRVAFLPVGRGAAARTLRPARGHPGLGRLFMGPAPRLRPGHVCEGRVRQAAEANGCEPDPRTQRPGPARWRAGGTGPVELFRSCRW